MIDPYGAELARHERTIANIRAEHEKLIRLTVQVFINGGAIDKHENVRSVNDPGMYPALLWNGDVVADQPLTGLVMVSRTRYPVTPILETELVRKFYVDVGQVRANEEAWATPARLADIVREWLERADA